jgi:7-keto-8-aminopelargonate synthetase-like enzyme
MLPEPIQQIDRVYALWRGRKFHYFAGCDYLGMASDPEVLQSAQTALKEQGLNVAASRKTTGNHSLYGDLEEKLRHFFGAPAAVLVSSGYLSNPALAQALKGQAEVMLLDELAHGSLQDAAELGGFQTVRFKHRNPGDFRAKIAECRGKRVLAATDGVFALSGKIAPVADYLKSLPSDGWLLIDDSHGAGVLGGNGRGTASHFHLSDSRIIQTTTLSKAFGVYGGAILGSAEIREKIVAGSRIFTGNTPLPLPLAAAAMTALDPRKNQQARAALRKRIEYFQSRWMPDWDGATPILALAPKGEREKAELLECLSEASVYPSFILYPGGPQNGCFRFAFSAEHSVEQLDALGRCLRKKELCEAL